MDEKLVSCLMDGGIAVIPTDTIYGIVGSALNTDTVEKIYQLRKRSKDKPFIILISSIKDLEKFDIELAQKQKEFLEKNWPSPLSVILSVEGDKFKYLHRDKNSLAFRMPKNKQLLDLLERVGPLVAPSANFEGEKPAETINEAKKYFGDQVFYVDEDRIIGGSSTLVKLNEDGSFIVLRQGSYEV